jgi:hypothetical protein
MTWNRRDTPTDGSDYVWLRHVNCYVLRVQGTVLWGVMGRCDGFLVDIWVIITSNLLIFGMMELWCFPQQLWGIPALAKIVS